MKNRALLWVGGLLLLLAAGVLWYGGLSLSPGGQPRYRPVELDPEKTYRLTYWDYRYPLQALSDEAFSDYAAFVEAMLAAFRREHPNVEVEVRLLNFDEGEQALADALKDGEPPDVYAGWWETPPNPHPLQVPVTPYLAEQDLTGYHPAAWPLVSDNGKAWAWPRWLTAQGIVANQRLLSELGVDARAWLNQGWSYADLATLSGRARGQGISPLAVVESSGQFMRSLLLAAEVATAAEAGGGNMKEPPDGAWSRATLERSLTLLDDLRAQDYLTPRRQVEDGGWLEGFLQSRVLLIGGANPALSLYILRNAVPPQVDPVFLPYPTPIGGAVTTVASVGVVTVYRQSNYEGAEHTQAAMELARFVSRWKTYRLLGSFLAIPARLGDLAQWQQLVPLPPEVSAALLAMLDGPGRGHPWTLYPLGLDGTVGQSERFRREVEPVLSRYWSGEATKEELTAALEKLLPATGDQSLNKGD